MIQLTVRDIRKHACLEVKTRVSGSQIWLQESTAEILTGSIPFIFSSLVTTTSETVQESKRKANIIVNRLSFLFIIWGVEKTVVKETGGD